jgi:hypothetical protein
MVRLLIKPQITAPLFAGPATSVVQKMRSVDSGTEEQDAMCGCGFRRQRWVIMQSKLILAVVAAMLALVSQSSAATFELFSYSGNKYTTNPDPAEYNAR